MSAAWRKRRAVTQQVVDDDDDDDSGSPPSSSSYEAPAACPYPESDVESLEAEERRAQDENPSPSLGGGDDAMLEPDVPVLHDVASARGRRERARLRAANIEALLDAVQRMVGDARSELARLRRDATDDAGGE